MRYAFLKYGDVIDELKEIGPVPQYVPESGPKTFTANYLKLANNNPALIISCGSYKHNSVYKNLNVEARIYNQFSGLLRIYSMFIVTAKILCRLTIYRPNLTVCVQNGPALWATYLACKFIKKPFIHSRQRAISIKGDSWRRKLSVRIDNYVVRRASKVICHGPFTKSQLVEIGVPNDKIIEYDVCFNSLLKNVNKNKILLKSSYEDKNKTILFLGRVEESKGAFDLLDACIPILHMHPEVKLIYVGDGQGLTLLKERIHQRDLGTSILVRGKVPHEKIVDFLDKATLLAMPTRHGLEGWPMSALEALAMGVPVIAPDAGPFKFMIKDGVNGLLFDVNSVNDLRKKIERIITESDLRDLLSQGAIEWEEMRSNSLLSFGRALKLAHEQIID